MRAPFRWLLVLAVSALFATSCGGSGSSSVVTGEGEGAGIDIEPTRDFLLAAAARSATSSYNFEMSMSMVMDAGFFTMELSGDEPMAYGTARGDQMAMTMDLGVIFADLADSMGGLGEAFSAEAMGVSEDQLVMEMITDGTDLYLHAPLLGAEGMGAQVPGLSAVVDGWGRIDLTKVPDLSAGDLASLTGQGSADPSQMLRVLEGATDDITEDGREELRGTDTTRLVAQVTMARLMEAQGAGQLDQLMGQVGADPAGAAVMESLLDTPVDVVVNVDDQGRIRRFSFDMDLGPAIAAAAAESGEALGEFDMKMGMVMDLFDYGTDAAIEVPADAVDITDELARLAAIGAV